MSHFASVSVRQKGALLREIFTQVGWDRMRKEMLLICIFAAARGISNLRFFLLELHNKDEFAHLRKCIQ